MTEITTEDRKSHTSIGAKINDLGWPWRVFPRSSFALDIGRYCTTTSESTRSGINYQASQVIAVCGRRSRCSCTFLSSVCQQPAVAHSLS